MDAATQGYGPDHKPQFFVDKLAEGAAVIAAAFYPKDVILRLSDFKTNEYANLIGGRQAATLLTKATWTAGGLFMALALMLSIVSSRQRAPESILRDTFTPQTTAPAPVLPGATGAPGATGPTQPANQQAPQTTPPTTTR